ncbi:alkylation response protein AidB-like acyl-CoA dehydrogenase [Spinactinospora alkalitolerans]|uniref:Alkylation response protein AidB-like acyl-CoA dehydrogenase n=1 Tax=Spinactinospora alkalitolerans TaxID=687207 RepID=A0A852U1H1_9ACTN|nr:acyl-CoA dehydrogenase family protein [Spinactinospora alkalitolerans]NYE47840.1 alkylation response protein AidB-like acyl-CoA dehydrogenase [Spinactinospora alkalitolerans]
MSTDVLAPDEVRAALRDYFSDHPGLAETRRLRDGDHAVAEAGFDRARWSDLAGEVGLAAMGAPAEADGLGLGLEHLVAALEECGTTLYPGPARAAALLAWSSGLTADRSDRLGEAVTRLVEGAAVPAFAQFEGAGRDSLELSADGLLRGRVRGVTHATAADLLLAVAGAPDGPRVVVADLGAGGVRRALSRGVDFAGVTGELELGGVPATALTEPGDTAAVARFDTAARILLAAEQVGGAEGCLRESVSYALVRTQFGRLIGGYQAVQHRCARTAVAVASAKALVSAAARAVDDDEDSARMLGLLAKAEASDVFQEAADGLVQVCGGIGFTWEHDAHLFFRKARSTAVLGGTSARLRHQAVEDGCLNLIRPATT